MESTDLSNKQELNANWGLVSGMGPARCSQCHSSALTYGFIDTYLWARCGICSWLWRKYMPEILHQDLDLLKYVENKFAQEMIDNEVAFGRPATSAHIEFYVYGPTHIAVCIYKTVPFGEILHVGERLELLVLKKGSDTDTVDRAVKEMLNMIRKKKEIQIERRLKR